jgi:hypothetical protein
VADAMALTAPLGRRIHSLTKKGTPGLATKDRRQSRRPPDGTGRSRAQ